MAVDFSVLSATAVGKSELSTAAAGLCRRSLPRAVAWPRTATEKPEYETDVYYNQWRSKSRSCFCACRGTVAPRGTRVEAGKTASNATCAEARLAVDASGKRVPASRSHVKMAVVQLGREDASFTFG